jgi:hypothetical protein
MASSSRNKAGFQLLYRKIYAELGFELEKNHGVPEAAIKKAEKKAEITIPPSLRDYYLVAGKEKTLNTIFNVLLPPENWEVHRGKLVFMQENQCVVVWGVSLKDKHAKDPDVFQTAPVDDELTAWRDEKSTCSQFLVFMLHLQAAYGGGMRHCASAAVPRKTVSLLDKDWSFGGEVNGMRTYRKPGQSICFVKWKEFSTGKPEWRIFAGAQEEKSLDTIAEELKIEWEKQ